MQQCFVRETTEQSTLVHLIMDKTYPDWLRKQDDAVKSWLASTQYKGEAGSIALIPDVSARLKCVIVCVSESDFFWGAGRLPFALPEGVYHFEQTDSLLQHAIAFGLGAYQFTRYKKATRAPAQLRLSSTDWKEVTTIVDSIYLVRDLINTPADDMGPSELSRVVNKLAHEFHATSEEIIGQGLLQKNYPAIHAVGRASDDAPRLLDLRWGNPAHFKLTLVGKGVCFDTGGLDIKTSPYMLLMKKDMAGAAHVLGLARMIMAMALPVCLRVLIPAVENAISGNAYRPGDVIQSRKGLTIEIGNTDAEGRVVLCDALAEAVSETPDLLIDMATLTGAARVAVGTELSAAFSNNDAVIQDVMKWGEKLDDPIWRLPLFTRYRELLNSQIADINNCSAESYAGAITAALFLKEFVPNTIPWLHFDIMAWNTKTRPGRPQGGEAMSLRALYAYIRERCYSSLDSVSSST